MVFVCFFAMLKNVFLVIYISTYNNVHNNVTYTKYNTGGKLMPILSPSGGWEGGLPHPTSVRSQCFVGKLLTKSPLLKGTMSAEK